MRRLYRDGCRHGPRLASRQPGTQQDLAAQEKVLSYECYFDTKNQGIKPKDAQSDSHLCQGSPLNSTQSNRNDSRTLANKTRENLNKPPQAPVKSGPPFESPHRKPSHYKRRAARSDAGKHPDLILSPFRKQ